MDRIKLIWANLMDVIPNPLNPRRDHSTKTEEMQRIIKEKGWEAGITCYAKESKYVILSGHRRWYAAKELGIQKVPVVLVKAPQSESEELERLGSVQGGKVDWSVYEWAKHTYEMWTLWDKCSYQELARKMATDSAQIAIRIAVFKYYPHREIESRLASGTYSMSALYYLIKWLEKLEKYKFDLVSTYDRDLIRTTMLRKIEMKLVSVDDLKNDMLLQVASDEQIKNFLVNIEFKFVDVMDESWSNKSSGSNRFRAHSLKIDDSILQVHRIEAQGKSDASEVLKSLEKLKQDILEKQEYLREAFSIK